MNGIVIIDKPEGWTSQDVVSKLRGVLHTKRIGHGGTLDPMATGVLPVFVGRATRGVEFFEHAEKTYETVLRLGITTDTEDITGTVLTEQDAFVTGEQLEQVLEQFRGEIMQVPPMYSALKVNGQKLVDLARKGKEVERKPRPITIHELTLISMEADGIHLRVRCSKGTYIRTLCKDIGEALGCGGCMASLRRVQAGEYTINEAVPLQELVEAAGGYKPSVDLKKAISGGPMMGFAMANLDVPVQKSNNAITLLGYDAVEEAQKQMTACLRCGRCNDACSLGLVPQMMAQAAERKDYDRFENKLYGMECVACGSCTYICPAKRPLMQLFKQTKAEIMAAKRAAQAAKK